MTWCKLLGHRWSVLRGHLDALGLRGCGAAGGKVYS